MIVVRLKREWLEAERKRLMQQLTKGDTSEFSKDRLVNRILSADAILDGGMATRLGTTVYRLLENR